MRKYLVALKLSPIECKEVKYYFKTTMNPSYRTDVHSLEACSLEFPQVPIIAFPDLEAIHHGVLSFWMKLGRLNVSHVSRFFLSKRRFRDRAVELRSE